jgi:guanine deaminase
MQDEDFMRMAIEKARQGIIEGQTPFGACIVKDRRVLAVEHNAVWATTDITAHAEIVAIREVCRDLVTVDLSGCTIYSTTEPCPMCFSACHWAGASRIVYGTEIADVAALGFHELRISNQEMKRLGNSPVEIQGGLLRDENLALLREWAGADLGAAY